VWNEIKKRIYLKNYTYIFYFPTEKLITEEKQESNENSASILYIAEKSLQKGEIEANPLFL